MKKKYLIITLLISCLILTSGSYKENTLQQESHANPVPSSHPYEMEYLSVQKTTIVGQTATWNPYSLTDMDGMTDITQLSRTGSSQGAIYCPTNYYVWPDTTGDLIGGSTLAECLEENDQAYGLLVSGSGVTITGFSRPEFSFPVHHIEILYYIATDIHQELQFQAKIQSTYKFEDPYWTEWFIPSDTQWGIYTSEASPWEFYTNGEILDIKIKTTNDDIGFLVNQLVVKYHYNEYVGDVQYRFQFDELNLTQQDSIHIDVTYSAENQPKFKILSGNSWTTLVDPFIIENPLTYFVNNTVTLRIQVTVLDLYPVSTELIIDCIRFTLNEEILPTIQALEHIGGIDPPQILCNASDSHLNYSSVTFLLNDSLYYLESMESNQFGLTLSHHDWDVWKTDWENLSDGNYSIEFTAVDVNGNTISYNTSLIKESIRPSITVTDIVNGTVFGAQPPILNIIVEDEHLDPTSVSCQVSGVDFYLDSINSTHFTLNENHSHWNVYDNLWDAGQHQFIFTAFDRFGNVGETRLTI